MNVCCCKEDIYLGKFIIFSSNSYFVKSWNCRANRSFPDLSQIATLKITINCSKKGFLFIFNFFSIIILYKLKKNKYKFKIYKIFLFRYLKFFQNFKIYLIKFINSQIYPKCKVKLVSLAGIDPN